MWIDKDSDSFGTYIVKKEESLYKTYLKMMSNREKTLVVVSENLNIEGTITSGDFKRKISHSIKKQELEDSKLLAKDIMNKSFYFLKEKNESLENCNHLLVPLVKRKKINGLLVRGSPNKKISISDKLIGEGEKTFVIAEIGVNHDGDISIAKNLIDDSLSCGADLVKFQHRSLENTYIDSSDENSELATESTLEHLKKVNFSIDQMKELFDYSRKKGIEPICTPFDLQALEEVMTLNPVALKAASCDLLNFDLLERMAKTNLPIIISTGMHEEDEIVSSVNFLRLFTSNLIVLHCVSSYPAEISSLNLRYIDHLKKITGCLIGYSSHDNGIYGSLAAASLGAAVIEKHITWNRKADGPDHNASSEKKEFEELCNGVNEISKSLGPINISDKKLSQGEIINRSNLSKSLYASRNIKSGETIKDTDLLCKSPGIGIPCSSKKFIIGKPLLKDIKKNESFFDSFFYESNLAWDTLNNAPLNTEWGIPVRFRDVSKAVEIFNPSFLEFHLTYSDLNFDDYGSLSIKDCGVKVHAPELFENNFILDLAANEKKIRDISIGFMERTIEVAHQIYSSSAQNTTLDLIINPGGHSSDHFFKKEQKLKLFENLKNSFDKLDFGLVNPIIQSMPPYPWHLGGRRYHNMFVECEDFKLWHEMTGLFFCIDYSHSFLASKYLNIPFEEYISKIKKYSSYFHIADADGDDGEGLQILEGEINFKSLYSEILVDEKFQFIPEIWQGHIDNFEGFKLALQKLRHLGW
jgi:N-acetylneuraminate synthase